MNSTVVVALIGAAATVATATVGIVFNYLAAKRGHEANRRLAEERHSHEREMSESAQAHERQLRQGERAYEDRKATYRQVGNCARDGAAGSRDGTAPTNRRRPGAASRSPGRGVVEHAA